MTLDLYNISDNPKQLYKTIGDSIYQTTQTIKPYEPISDLTGSILITYSSTAEDCNYAKIVDDAGFTKYYFVTDKQLEVGGKMRIYLEIDVLMTFQEDILNCPAVYDRSDCFPNYLLDDGMERVSVKRDVEFIGFMIPGQTIAQTVDNPPLNYPDKILTIVML